VKRKCKQEGWRIHENESIGEGEFARAREKGVEL